MNLTFTLAIALVGWANLGSADDWLDPAVEETKQVFLDAGLPADWLPLDDFDPKEVDPLFLTGAWAMVKHKVAKKFQSRYGTMREPTSLLICLPPRKNPDANGKFPPEDGKQRVGFMIPNAAFEETVLRAFWGPEHTHERFLDKHSARPLTLPNIRRKYLLVDGAVNFELIRQDFAKLLASRFNLADDLKTSKAESKYCWVVSQWQEPDAESLPWVRKQLAWRTTFVVGFASGQRQVPGLIYSGGKRLVVDAYLGVGYRATEAEPFRYVYSAGPYRETAYKPVGHGTVYESRSFITHTDHECQMTISRDTLASLNDNSPTSKTDDSIQFSLMADNATLFGERIRQFHDALDQSLRPTELE